MKRCFYCKRKAKFQIKNKKWCCSKSYNSCPINRIKNSNGVKRAHESGKIPGWKCLWQQNKIKSWNKNLTKEIDERVKKNGKNISKANLGKKRPPLSKEHKQKLSLKMSERNNGYVKTKYFEIFSKFQNLKVKVQGTWEFKYAKYLNINNINWIRSKKINLKYKLFKNDYIHTYFPDFYLPDSKEYIEIKGFWWKSKDGRVDDKRKMRKVKAQNKNKKIIILTKKELKKLKIL
jgi:hypothetical protein